MRSIRLAIVLECLFCAATQAGSVIQYTLELGGDNQVAKWEGGWNPPFIAGDPADGKTVCAGSVLTWDAVVEVSGTYDHDDDPGTPEIQSNGAANLVFTLELREWTGTEEGALVGTQVFFSTMNDGDPGGLPEDDPLEMADFCHVYDIPCVDNGGPCTGNGPHDDGEGGPGRLFDPADMGGPCLDRVQYPSTMFHAGGSREGGIYTPAGGPTWEPPGKLVGMSAGYSQYNPVNDGGCATPGVGISPYAAGLTCLRGLGHVPNFEGQIDTTGLAVVGDQWYILKLVPGAGNNVLRGDFECAYGVSEFAVPADEVYGDSIKFWVRICCCPPPSAVTQWSSVRSHGAPVYALSVPGASSTANLTETRQGGVQTIVVEFDWNVQEFFKTKDDIVITKVGDQYAMQPPAPPPGTGSCFTVSSVAWPAADQMELTLTPGTHSVACQVDLSSAFTYTALTNPKCTFHICDGNINYDSKTDLTDMALSKANATTVPAIQASARPDYDVNVDNKIDLTDMALIKNMTTGSPKIFCP